MAIVLFSREEKLSSVFMGVGFQKLCTAVYGSCAAWNEKEEEWKSGRRMEHEFIILGKVKIVFESTYFSPSACPVSSVGRAHDS